MHWLAQIVFALGLMVKVAQFNEGTGKATFHLPMHNTNIAAVLEGGQSSDGVEKGKFYKADMRGQALVVKVKKKRCASAARRFCFWSPDEAVLRAR